MGARWMTGSHGAETGGDIGHGAGQQGEHSLEGGWILTKQVWGGVVRQWLPVCAIRAPQQARGKVERGRSCGVFPGCNVWDADQWHWAVARGHGQTLWAALVSVHRR